MVSDQELARLQLAIYGMSSVEWDYRADGDIVWGAKKMGDVTAIVLRGSTVLKDWVRDFTAIANPLEHDALGPVHPGFFEGMPEMWAVVKAKTSGPWIVAGHSLGAGRAAILAGLMTLDGQAPLMRVVWGEPKPGFNKLADLIQGIPARSYRNGNGKHHDLITDVPLSFPPEEYVRATELVDVCAIPPAGDEWGIFAWHHMPLYAQALGN